MVAYRLVGGTLALQPHTAATLAIVSLAPPSEHVRRMGSGQEGNLSAEVSQFDQFDVTTSS